MRRPNLNGSRERSGPLEVTITERADVQLFDAPFDAIAMQFAMLDPAADAPAAAFEEQAAAEPFVFAGVTAEPAPGRLPITEGGTLPNAAFGVGNIVVYRVGTAAGPVLDQSAAPVFLDEYTPAGVLVQSIALPVADEFTGNQTLTARGVSSGAQPPEGNLTLSTDGRYLILTGYDAAPGTANVSSTQTNVGVSPVVRVIGRVGVDGVVDTTTTILGFSGGNVRAAASADGSRYWAVGSNTGVVFQQHGATDAGDIVSNGLANLRSIEIFGGNLHVGSAGGSGAAGVATVGPLGTGLPTGPNNTITTLPGIPGGILANQMVMLDRDAGVAGLDTLYIADLSAGLRKFSFDGTTWTNRGTLVINISGIEARVDGANAVIYYTTLGTNGNALATLTDTTAFNAGFPFGGLPSTTIASAAGNSGFRGVAFAPQNPQVLQFIYSGEAIVAETEGNAGVVIYSFTVGRTGGDSEINFSGTIATGAFDPTGTFGFADADDFAGGVFPTTFSGTIAQGSSTATVLISVRGDTVVEPNDRFVLTLTSATSAGGGANVVISNTRGSINGVILDDENGYGFNSEIPVQNLTGAAAALVGFTVIGAADGDGAGYSVAGPGDIDRDGLDDVLVGAPYFDVAEAANAGAVYILGGKPGTRLDLDLGALDEADGLDVRAAFAEQNLGLSVGPGFESDYFDPNDSTGAQGSWSFGDSSLFSPIGGSRPSAWVLKGGSITRASFVQRVDDLFPSTTFRLLGPNEPHFGEANLSKNRAGDVNGDGLRDMAIGLPGLDGSATAGRTYVVFWNGRDLAGDVALPQDPNDPTIKVVEITGDAAGDRAGRAIDICEDFNGDGYDDLAIGAPRGDDGGADAGEVYLVFGKANLADMDLTGLAARPVDGLVVLGEEAGDHAGGDVSSCDFNGDGLGDLIIGAAFNDAGGADAGAVYVVFGQSGPGGMAGFAEEGAALDLGALGAGGFKILGANPGDLAGFTVTGVGDLDGDGYDEVAIGAPNANNGAGAVYVVLGRPGNPGTIDLSTLFMPSGFRLDGGNPGDALGSSIAGAGDLNGDGYDDLVAGAKDALTAGGRTGAAYVLYGRATTGATANSAGNDERSGTAGDDLIELSAGGDDSVNGGAGNDGFRFGASFTGADRVDGGNGNNDQIGLQGDYTGVNALVLRATTIKNVEVIALLNGGSYNITTVDANLAPGQTLKIHATQLGESDNFTFNGAAELNRGSYILYGGFGVETWTGGSGDDGFYFGQGRYGPSDIVNGGAGTNDQLGLDGSYGTLFAPFLLSGARISGIEVIALLQKAGAPTNNYFLASDEALVANGETLTIWGVPLEGSLFFLGSAETDGGAFRIFGGTTVDAMVGGGATDWFHGGLGGDSMDGQGGADIFAYTAASQSTGVNFDRLVNFDDNADKIDLPGTVAGFAAPGSGTLSQADFDAELAAGVNAALGPNQAIIFTATAGTYAGRMFGVVDGNGDGDYQAGSDYVFEFVTPVTPIDQLGMFS